MYLKLSLIILISVLISLILRKKIESLLFVFVCLWTVVIFLYDLQLFNIYDISLDTEKVIFGGVIGFISGHAIAEKVHFNLKNSRKIKSQCQDTKINFYFVNIVFSIILIIGAYYYIPNIIIGIKNGGAKVVKGLLMSGELSTGDVGVQYIVRPFSKIMIATSAYCIINNREQKKTIILGIVMMLFELLGMWSKSSLVFFALCLVLSFLMNIDVMGRLASNRIVLASV